MQGSFCQGCMRLAEGYQRVSPSPPGLVRFERSRAFFCCGGRLMNRCVFLWVLLSMAVSLGPVSAQDGPDSVTGGTKQFRKRVLVSGLAGPWSSHGVPITCSGQPSAPARG
jgi:hypothetical protein